MTKKRTIYISDGYISGFNPDKPKSDSKASGPEDKEGTGRPPRTRGRVSKFSHRSRREMLKTLARIPRTSRPELFVTLTYPPKNPSYDIKAHINKLANSIRYNYPEGWFVYRIERGDKAKVKFHVHMVGLLGAVQKPRVAFPAWLFQKWLKIGGFTYYEPKRLVDVEPVKDWVRTSKYITKREELLLSMDGHRWGVINKRNLPQAELAAFEVDAATYERVKAVLAEHLERVKEEPFGSKTPKGMRAIIKHRDDYIRRFEWQADYFLGFLPDDVVEMAKRVISEEAK